MPKYFGTDGIRGKSPEWLNEQMAYNIGYALGDGLKAKKLLVGRDTRQSGNILSKAIIQGALDNNVKVVNLGIVSTPMLAYLTITEECFGAMITASHNPHSDNGIKIIERGEKSSEAQEDILESYLSQSKDFKIHQYIAIDAQVLTKYKRAIEKLQLPKTNLNIVLDTAHGSLSPWANEILSNYANVIKSMGDKPDGFNINLKVGSTNIESLVKSTPKFMIGFAFDGDGDRLIAVDETGKVVSGDQVLAFINYFSKISQKLVLTQMVNPGIKETLNNLGIEVIESKIGDKHVFDAMKEADIPVGGEDSGHMIFNNVWPVGDGIISALILLKTLHQNNITLHEAAQLFTKYPEKLLNFNSISKEKYNSNKDLQSKLNEIKEKIVNDKGKLLVRPSGTEDVIRVYISHKSKAQLAIFQLDLIKVFESHGGTL